MANVKISGDVTVFINVVHARSSTCERFKFAANKENLKWEAVGDGNLNDVVRVYVNSDDLAITNVIVKYAPPFIKCLGPENLLSVERGYTEYKALTKFYSLSPGCCPEPFFYESDQNVICMEDLRDYVVFRKQLVQGVCEEAVVKCIARDIALVHRDTHIGKLNTSEFNALKQQFGYTELIDLTKKFVFTGPFDKHEVTNDCSANVKEHLHSIYDDDDVLSTAEKMKKIFLEKKECLVHGDLHTGSVMVSNGKAKMIDLEFAYVGPAAFDVGSLLANYIFSYYQHMSTEENHDLHRKFAYSVIEICKKTVNTYFEYMTSFTGDHESYKENFLSEVAGFTGCEIVRRIVGAAHVEDLANRPHAQVDCLGAGVRLLKASDKIMTVDKLLIIAFMLI